MLSIIQTGMAFILVFGVVGLLSGTFFFVSEVSS